VSWGDANDAGRQFESLHHWFNGWLATHYARPLDTGGRVWCPHWHEHPEAVSRLTALWLEWERAAAGDGRGMAGWWLSYCDPTMAVLLDPDGPFTDCRRGHVAQTAVLPIP
jgi:hypothetical protein